MSGLVPWTTDPIRPERPQPLHITVDGTRVEGLQGQSIAGVLLAQDRTAWRTTTAGRPRGVFCGIGVCFDCIATVNGESDVRLCMRRAQDGDAVATQDDTIPCDRGPQVLSGSAAAGRESVASGTAPGPGDEPQGDADGHDPRGATGRESAATADDRIADRSDVTRTAEADRGPHLAHPAAEPPKETS